MNIFFLSLALFSRQKIRKMFSDIDLFGMFELLILTWHLKKKTHRKKKLEVVSPKSECEQHRMIEENEIQAEKHDNDIPKITLYNLFCPDLMRDDWMRSRATNIFRFARFVCAAPLMLFGHFKWAKVILLIFQRRLRSKTRMVHDTISHPEIYIYIPNTCMYFT